MISSKKQELFLTSGLFQHSYFNKEQKKMNLTSLYTEIFYGGDESSTPHFYSSFNKLQNIESYLHLEKFGESWTISQDWGEFVI